jgi:hypothetical protein
MTAANFSQVKLILAFVVFSALALLALPGPRSPRFGCQPTIMQPCANATVRASHQATAPSKSTRADKDNGAKDHSPRIRLDSDTEFKFGTGAIGLGRKF